MLYRLFLCGVLDERGHSVGEDFVIVFTGSECMLRFENFLLDVGVLLYRQVPFKLGLDCDTR